MLLSVEALRASLLGASLVPESQVYPWIASAVAEAIVNWMTTSVVVQGTATGVIGVGTVSGTLQFVSLAQLQASFASLPGKSSQLIAQSLQQGLASGLPSVQYQGTCVAVGSGTDVSFVTQAPQPSLYALLLSKMEGQNLDGLSAPFLANAISQGVASFVSTGFGFGSVSGGGGNIPAVGVTVSKLV